jgi:hypothetical protein
MFTEKQIQKEATQDETVTKLVAKTLPKFKFKKPADDIDKAIQCFLTGNTGKFGKYFAVKNALVYRTIVTSNNGSDQELCQNIIALRLTRPSGDLFIGNSSILPLIGRSVTYGNEHLNRSVQPVQTRLSRYITMIPFSVFTEANLDLTQIEVLDKGPEETVTRIEQKWDARKKEDVPVDVEVHFTGASVFRVENKTFLFDIDRREIEHKIFNAFLVELTKPVATVKEAYDSLMPDEVKQALKKGLDVKRQGEWFFIPVKGEFEPVKARPNRWDKKQFEPLTLRAGENRPNTASKYHVDGKTQLVSGLVEHSGREHANLVLKGWYKPVVNTSIQSFTLTGDVD